MEKLLTVKDIQEYVNTLNPKVERLQDLISIANTPGMVNLPALFKIQAKAIELADVMGFEVDIKNPFSDDLRAEYMAERLGVPMV